MMREHPPAKLLLDVEEVAQILGVGRSHLYTYLLRGQLRSLKLGRRRKIPVEAVREFITKLQEEEGSPS
jgi:excisionase family DNA binding protein